MKLKKKILYINFCKKKKKNQLFATSTEISKTFFENTDYCRRKLRK